jgi:asparagine synthase (glutamine-hydrolysing)
VWGSEAKCLLAGGLDARIDFQSLHDYLTLGYVPGPASIFSGVEQLPTGHVLIAEPGRTREIRPYWSLRGHATDVEHRSEAEWQGELVRTLRAAVQSHLMSDVPLGVFLSGGLDSGTIVALMHELGVSPIRPSRSARRKSFSETDQAREVASATGPSTTSSRRLTRRPAAAGPQLRRAVRRFVRDSVYQLPEPLAGT